jgi:hypothetical protein
MGSFSKVMLHAYVYIYTALAEVNSARRGGAGRERKSLFGYRDPGATDEFYMYRSVAINKNKIN